jgi:GTP cyclohydrolase I
MSGPTTIATMSMRTTLRDLGLNLDGDGLKDTPGRWVRAMQEMTRGYKEDPAAILATTFEGDGYDQLVLLKDIPFASLCEHHLLPFVGRAHVGYIPKDRVVGLSKLARVVDAFARRLQIQERMTKQIADAIASALLPLGVGVMIEATHSCMAVRGVAKPGALMVTSDVRGVFREKEAARAEFFALIGGRT